MKNIIVKINDAVKTVQQIAVTTNDGQPTTIKAGKHVNYQFIDQANGRGPDHIVTKRVNKDLHISFEDEGQDSDLIIENFYEDDNAALIGQAEDGQLYYYIPDTGEVADYVTQLAMGDIEGQALGGNALSSPWWAGVIETKASILPWLVGGLLGAGAIAAAVAGDKDDKDTTPNAKAKTATPSITAENKDSDNDGVDDKTVISGKTEPNAKVTITLPNGKTQTVTADKDGNYKVEVPVLKQGDKVSATATAPNKDGSDPKEATVPAVDTTPNDNTADAPTITPSTTDGSVTVTPGADNKTNKVTFTDEAGKPHTITATKGKDGWTLDDKDNTGATIDKATGKITIPQDSVKDGSKVTATGTDDKNNPSTTSSGNAGKDTPVDNTADAPTITPSTTDGSVTVTPGADNKTNKVIFTDEAGNPHTITATKGKDGWTLDDKDNTGATIDKATGKITIPQDAIKDGSKVTATGTDDKNNPSTTSSGNAGKDTPVDNTADAPTITPSTTDGSVTVTPGADNVTNKVIFTDEAGKPHTITATKGKDGGWTLDDKDNTGATIDKATGKITIPQDAIKDGSKVTATGTDDKNNPSTTSSGNAGKDTPVDNTADAPTITPSTTDGSVTVTPGADNVTNKVIFTDEAGNPHTITATKGKDGWTLDDKDNTGATIDKATGKITIPQDAIKDGSKVTATGTDDKNNPSTTSSGNAGKDTPVDNTADAPTITPSTTDGSVTVTPGADNVTNKVIFTDEAGKPHTITATKGKDGGWTLDDKDNTGATIDKATGKITIPQDAIKDGSKVTATGTDDKNNPSTTSSGNAGKDTPVDNTADAPTITPSTTDGSVTVTPGADNVTNKVIFTDEAGKPHTITATKGKDGGWTLDDKDNTGATIDKATGKITIPQDAIKDGSKVTATGTDDKNNPSTTSSGNAGKDTPVDNTADAPTITPSTTDGSVTVTPGADNKTNKVIFTDEAGKSHTITATKGKDGWTLDDKDNTGATIDKATGKITIPQDSVKDGSKVTATGTDDKNNPSTTSSGNAGNDASGTAVADGSDAVVTKPNTPNAEKGADEGTNLITTIKLTNNNGGSIPAPTIENGEGNTKGKANNGDFDLTKQSFVGKDNQGNPVKDGVTKNGNQLTIKPGVQTIEVTTPIKNDKTTEGDETVKVVVNGKGNEVTIKDTSVAPVKAKTITGIKLADNLTDETQNAQNFYPNKDTKPYVGDVKSGNGDKAVSLATGLTNDTTPTLNFSLDKALATGQQVVVTRYTIVNGVRTNAEEVLTATTGKDFEYTEAELEQTYGTDYEYEIELLTDGAVTATQSHTFRLDTMVEAMQVTGTTYNESTKGIESITFTARDNSEVGATLSATYKVGTETRPATVTETSPGVYEVKTPGFNHRDVNGLELTIVDAAGNVNTQKVNMIRNLLTDYNLEQGPDTTATGTGIGNRSYANSNGGYDDGYRDGVIQSVATAANSGLTATAGNDTLIIGMEYFNDFTTAGTTGLPLNGVMSNENSASFRNPNRSPNIDTGAGDDFIHVRGMFLAPDANYTWTTGAGNDKVQIDNEVFSTLVGSNFNLDMADGHDMLYVNGYIAAAINSNLSFGAGNDTMIVQSNFDGNKTVDFGDGDNTLKVGGYINNQGTITFGDGNDTTIVAGDFVHNTLVTGGGNDSVFISGEFYNVGNSAKKTIMDTGTGDDVITLNNLGSVGTTSDSTADIQVLAGEGNDQLTITGWAVRGLVDMGAGDDTVSLNDIYSPATNSQAMRMDGGIGTDTLKLTGTEDKTFEMKNFSNFENVDMTADGKQMLKVTLSDLVNNESNKLYITGDSLDIVELGTGNNNLDDNSNGSNLAWTPMGKEGDYNVYVISSADQWVYIHQDITQII
ncbi:hypothetical protein LU293_04900 [Moraxella nasovis]|uniref:hypothetical protein n=1 Tax=Moraxella nasovis TaxID=2904121 RepID=UPI001F610C02|nr:hypothetical protein [Moraxella nasovis]UNU74235.1 hypothetical protein LU293_04900 [Moraxella nasovis]